MELEKQPKCWNVARSFVWPLVLVMSGGYLKAQNALNVLRQPKNIEKREDCAEGLLFSAFCCLFEKKVQKYCHDCYTRRNDTKHVRPMRHARDAVGASTTYAVRNVSFAYMSAGICSVYSHGQPVAQPPMNHAAPTPRYVLHVCMSFFITTCT